MIATLLACALAPGAGAVQPSWPMFGQNLGNTANAPNQDISTKNVGKLQPRWVATLGGDISARAAVVGGVAYVPDWAGNLWAINTSNGRTVWSHQLSDYGLAAGTVARSSPSVVDGVVYIGTQFNPSGLTGWLLAINAATGNLIWKTRPDTSNSFPVITASPTVANGKVFVGNDLQRGVRNGSPQLSVLLGTRQRRSRRRFNRWCAVADLHGAAGLQPLWSYNCGSSVIAGASIVNGAVFWGSGYAHLGIPGFTGNNKFFAFTLNGK